MPQNKNKLSFDLVSIGLISVELAFHAGRIAINGSFRAIQQAQYALAPLK
jgi:hypothetical protein